MSKSLRKNKDNKLDLGNKVDPNYNRVLENLRKKIARSGGEKDEELKALIKEFNDMLKQKSTREIHTVLNKIILRNDE
jgi:hypothetical protein